MTEPVLVYVAEPIDQAKNGIAAHVTDIVTSLRLAGYNLYRPRAAWVCGELDPRIDQSNREVLARCDAIVAYLPAGVPSIGVPTEIEYATARGLPAVVYHTGESQVLAGNPLVTVVDARSAIHQAVEHAVKQHPRVEPTVRYGEVLDFDPRGVRRQAAIKLIIRDGAEPPRRVYPDDAGIDLTTAAEKTIAPGEYLDIHTQVDAVQLPDGYWGMITGRSSTLRKYRLHVPLAIIDPGWRGPLFVGVWNLGKTPVTVKPGDRLGQLILVENNPATILQVEQVDEHARGLNGFGSSG